MANRRYAAFDYFKGCIADGERTVSFERRYNSVNFRIPFRINWTITLTIVISILACQFEQSLAERQALSSHGKRHYDQRCSMRPARKSMTPSETSQSVAEDPGIAPRDVLSRLEAAAVLRDNLVTTLGRVLLFCLRDDVRIPLEQVHDAVRNYRVAVYELLPVLPELRKKPPRQQLYKLMQMLERVDSRFVSEYASLSINAFSDVEDAVEQASLVDMLLDVDQEVIESIERDEHRADEVPSSLTKGIDFLLQAARNSDEFLNLRTASAILLNYPGFDLTDPEVRGGIRFVAARLKERSGSGDALLERIGASLENAANFLKTVLERLEVDELSSEIVRETASLLLQNFKAQPYPPPLSESNQLKRLLSTVTYDYYPVDVAAAAKYLLDHIDDSHVEDLDIGFYETGDRALLQTLSRLREKPHLQHLRKPLSLVIPFVSQKIACDANYDYTAPITFHEVNGYLDAFDTPCMPQNISDAINTARPYLSKDLPWTYAFGDRRATDDPRELILTSLIRLRNVPLSKSQEQLVDNLVYKARASDLTSKRGLLYESSVIFQRDNSTDVEVDLFSLLMHVPNAFNSEEFVPMLNFISKSNMLDILDFEFNKFEHETPRKLLLALLKRALTTRHVKSDESLTNAFQNARNYLEEPLLINLYVLDDMQSLLKYLPHIDTDSRYLPLKMFFKKQKLFAYLSSTFSLADARTPIERLLLVLKTVGLKTSQPKLSEALIFAVDNVNGPPLPIKAFDRSEFVYLVEQLLSRNKTLQNEILESYAYANVADWNISISGTPENVLARALNYPINYISSDVNLGDVAKRATDILEVDTPINIETLKERTLGAMLEYFPGDTYTRPVILLLKKANLMALVPELNITDLEAGTARDALVTLLKGLAESRVVRAQKSLLRRVRAALSSLDNASENVRQTPLLAHLIQRLRDPSNAIYQPLLLEIGRKQDPTTSPDERQAWLVNYFQRIVDDDEAENLTRAASMILNEITYDENLNEMSSASRKRIEEAVAILPTDHFVAPLKELLTPEWAYSILPENIRNSESLERNQLLLAILRHAKQREDVAGNPSLMKIISKLEAGLKGWNTSIESLRSDVTAMKAAVYDPVRKLLTADGLNKMKVTVPSGESAKSSLTRLFRRLLSHSVIKKNRNVSKLLSAIEQDVSSFAAEVDLLTVLDDVGIPYIDELAPVRLYLHRKDIGDRFAQIVLSNANPRKRYNTLLHVLQRQQRNDTQFSDALSTLKNIEPNKKKPAVLISDYEDILNAIPHRDRKLLEPIEYLFDKKIFSRLTADDEIVQSDSPLITLLSKIANLPEISGNRTVIKMLNRVQSNIRHLNYPIVTGFQLRPLLLELEHVRQINVDYLNSILNPEVLSYLNPEELDTSSDNIDILKNIINYLLSEGPAFDDYNMQRHLQSFKRVLKLTIGSSEPSRRYFTEKDWEKMLNLVPRKKDFTPVKIFLHNEEILKYIQSKETDWATFNTPVKKLLYLLSLIEQNDDVANESVHKSATKLQRYLKKRYDFITEDEVKDMHRTLANLKFKYDLVPLKIFLNHDNMIKYLPSNFKYAEYKTSIDAFAAVLDNLLKVPDLRRKVALYETMTFARRTLSEQNFSPARRSFQGKTVRSILSLQDLEFVGLLNMSLPKVREFFKQPEKLIDLLPRSFTFDHKPIFKTKASHLLRQLLKSNTDIHAELEGLVREVESYPDVPIITDNDVAPLLNVLPVEGVPYVGLVKKYLKPSTLIKLLPGNFDIKQVSKSAKMALYDVLFLLNATLGSAKSDQLKIALDMLIRELKKIASNVIPSDSIVDIEEVRAAIREIPFRQYKQLQRLKPEITTRKVISSLPLNFQLTEYKTMKLRVLAILNQLTKSREFQSSLDSIDFAIKLVDKMPDVPTVNDTEIEKLLLPLPLNVFNIKLLVKNCRVEALMPHLPIRFDLNNIPSRKMRLEKIMHYCKLANAADMSTMQALNNAEALLAASPDIDVTREHVRVLIRAIPCAHFTLIKPLLRFLSKTDVAPLLPWNFDVYRASRTFKQRVHDLLTAMRNVKELQTDEMFAALDSLETNAKSLPEQIIISRERARALRDSALMATSPCSDYRDYVLQPEIIIQALPPTFVFQFDYKSLVTSHSEWMRIMRLSRLFLREVADGSKKVGYDSCRDSIRKYQREKIFAYLSEGLNLASLQHLAPLRLYALGHGVDVTAPVENLYRDYSYGSLYSLLRMTVSELIRRPDLIKSKSVISDMEVFLHDYLMRDFREWLLPSKEKFYEAPSIYEIDRAVDEIPSERRYDDLKLLMRCPDIITSTQSKTLRLEDTPKQLLLLMLETAEKENIDDAIRDSVDTLKPYLVNGIRAEEVEYALKQMRDYRYHASKINGLRKYLASRGLGAVLGPDFAANYPTYKERLFAINDIMLAGAINRSTECTSECRAASEYLNRTLHDEIKIGHVGRRTIDDVNVESLLFALPRTEDEKVIRGIIDFFSVPDLLRKLKLPKDPFEYETKGRLLGAIMDLGQKLASVRQDPTQQEALEYYRNKNLTGSLGAQPIELNKYARDSNVDVDMYGVMRALDYAKINEDDAVRLATFFERKYDNLVHAVGFDHMAYATRGSYLSALFEHLVNVSSEVPDDARQQITSLMSAVRTDGPGEETVDLNADVVREEAPSMRMFGEIFDAAPTASFETETSHVIQEKKESLNAAIDNMLDTISSSEEEYLKRTGPSGNVYNTKTRINVGAPVHFHDTVRRKLNRDHSRMRETSKPTKKKNDSQPSKKLSLKDIVVPSNEAHNIVYKVIKKPKHDEAKNQQSRSTSSDYFSDEDENDSPVTKDRVVESAAIPSHKSQNSYPSRHKSVSQKSDVSFDIVYDDTDENAAKTLHGTSKNEKSLIEEFMSFSAE
ncbi:hypothetical protein PUN28_016227 [Cardiocondyla obscurior]|uniref:Uncharacterized protein n=1 Tax=Cardiocondyla obscurior TaxID=286306 RepID=A0AAW2EV46_9HYME